ncbi:MAG: helix-turn-helix transcriptional regulator [Bacteroidia bacterium]|nr:helix-turn-helix transcriptional regulator [Bacteroidia bacterium]
MLKYIKQFLLDYKKYMFKYRKGFYVIPALINSPGTLVQSYKHTPFVKWDPRKCKLSTNSPFAECDAYYIEISEGLWFYASYLNSKANLEFVGYFNESEPNDYYCFGYNLIKHTNEKKIALQSGLSYSVGSWNFFKPEHKLHHIIFKNTNIQFAGLYVSKKWVSENVTTNAKYLKSNLNLFINSNSTYSIWPDVNINSNFIEHALEIAKISDVKKRKQELNKFVNHTLDYLLQNYDVQHTSSLINADPDVLIKLNKVEKRLKDCLLSEFPGIESLAAEINVSPAKLKTDFKNYFGDSIYQYYLGKQLLFAHDLLLIHHKSVGETADILGYKNIGKFTVAFEKKFGVLPSKLIRKHNDK